MTFLPAGQLYWRCCAHCTADVATYDRFSINVYCPRHRPAERVHFDAWAASLGEGDTVFLYPVVAGHLSRSRWLIAERRGDALSVHVLGCPSLRREVRVTQCASVDMTPRPVTGGLLY